MSLHYALPLSADVIRAPGPWFMPAFDEVGHADSCIPTFANPCESSARFSVVDEDGSKLFDFELED